MTENKKTSTYVPPQVLKMGNMKAGRGDNSEDCSVGSGVSTGDCQQYGHNAANWCDNYGNAATQSCFAYGASASDAIDKDGNACKGGPGCTGP